MRKSIIPLLLAASLAAAAPAWSDTDIGGIVSGIAKTMVAQELDRSAYVRAQSLNTVSAYRDYLAKFPSGAYRGNARQALERLAPGVDPGSPPPADNGNQSAAYVEASIGLTRTQRIQIQQQLTAVGYPTGVADGLWGTNTRRAIGRWQTANRTASTGYLTSQQVRLIAQQAGPGVGSGTGGTVAGDDPVKESLLSLTYAERREVQSRLGLLGYRTGGVDGVFGRNTRLALSSWQKDEGLRPSGYLTADQLRALRRQTGA